MKGVADKFNAMVSDLTAAIALMDDEVMDNETTIDTLKARNEELDKQMISAEKMRVKIAGLVD